MSRGESLRKSLHIGAGFLALLLAHLAWWQALLCSAVAVLFNLYVMPRLAGKLLIRDGSGESITKHGVPFGVYAYPLAVGILCLMFPFRLDVVAVGWAMMAFGDGFAGLIAQLVGGKMLPWNPDKRWSGFAAFIAFGTIGSAVVYAHVAGQAWCCMQPAVWVALALVAALAAFLESYPSGINDNLVVPIAAALAFYSLDASGALFAASSMKFYFMLSEPMVQGGMIVAAVATLAYAMKLVSAGGLMGGWVLGTAVYGTTGWKGFLVLLAFFLLGTAATKWGYAGKAKKGIAQEAGGRRGAKHALANCSAAAWLSVCAAAAAFDSSDGAVWKIALVASLATALCDTLGTEMGQIYGKTPVLLPAFRRVPAGTEGAVSLEGTAAGAVGAFLLGGLAWAIGFIPMSAPMAGWSGVLIVGAAGVAGSLFESVAAGRLPKGRVDNEFMNFTNTVVGAAAAYVMAKAIF